MTELTQEEKHEAESMRYVDAARVIYLAPNVERETGKYVVYSMTRGQIIGVAENSPGAQDIGVLQGLVEEACRVSGELWARNREEEKTQPTVVVSGTAQDLGL